MKRYNLFMLTLVFVLSFTMFSCDNTSVIDTTNVTETTVTTQEQTTSTTTSTSLEFTTTIEETYYVVYFFIDDIQVTREIVLEGSTITPPINPVREDYIFEGWYINLDDSMSFDFSQVINTDVTLYAKFTTYEEQVSFDFMFFADGVEGDMMQSLLDKYELETGIEINIITLPYYDYETVLATEIITGDPPALIRVTSGTLANFEDSLVSLDKVYQDDQYMNVVRNSSDEIISLPMSITVNGLYANLDLLDQYNVNYPTSQEDIWTWDEFYFEMNKLKDQENVTNPIVIDDRGHRVLPLITYSIGTTVWNQPYTSSNLLDQVVVSQLATLMENFENGMISAENFGFNGLTGYELFRSGEYGCYFSGNWNILRFQDITEFEWTVLPMPTGPNGERGNLIDGKGISVVENSGYEEEAKDFIAWLAEAEHHDEFVSSTYFNSARRGAVIDCGINNAEYAVFQEEANNTPNYVTTDWKYMIEIMGMYPIINDFASEVAIYSNEKTALQLLNELLDSLRAVANG